MSDPVLVYMRSNVAKKGLKAIDRENKIIRGYAVNTMGEAQGHGLWLDSAFLDDVVKHGNALPHGLKARFTHPGLCADGMGKYLGRTKNLTRDGDVVRGDLHLADAASKSPDGDLADYVMSLAEEDPESFGASIVFARDRGAEKEFSGKNSTPEGKFQSPDKGNVNHLPHARMTRLRACDVVDEPAANPGGFLSSGEEMAARGEAVLSYLFGITTTVPDAMSFGGLDPERAKDFIAGFLQRNANALHIGRDDSGATFKEAPMPEPVTQPSADDVRKAERERASALKTAFPKHPSFAIEHIEKGSSLTEAQSAFKDVQLAELQAENAALKAAPKTQEKKPKTGPAPSEFSEESSNDANTGKDFMALSRECASANKWSLTAAMQKIALSNPEAHEEYVASSRGAKPRKVERPKVLGA